MKTNPWGLRHSEVRTLRSYLKHGSQKLVARAEGIALETVRCQMKSALRAMALNHRTAALNAFSAWDKREEA